MSRSAPRPARFSVQRATKSQALTVSYQGVTGRVTDSVEPTNPRDIAMLMLADCGWTDQFSCLAQLYVSESNWDPAATNPTSGTYGSPSRCRPRRWQRPAPTGRATPRPREVGQGRVLSGLFSCG